MSRKPKFFVGHILTIAILVFSASISTSVAQCRSGDMDIDLTIASAFAIDNSDGGLCGDPELFVKVFLDDSLQCIFGPNGSSKRFQGPAVCTFTVPEPYDPVTVRIELLEDDDTFCLGDEEHDITPKPGKALTFEYDPSCNSIRTPDGSIPECTGDFISLPSICSGSERTVRGTEGIRGELSFSIGPSDGLSAINNDLLLSQVELVQVVPDPSLVIADKPTVVRLNVGSTYDVDTQPFVRVDLRDKAGNVFTELKQLDVPACGTVDQEIFFDGGILPQDGNLNELTVTAVVDPNLEIDCTFPPCQELECRKLNNTVDKEPYAMASPDPVRVLYRPLPVDPFVCSHLALATQVDLDFTRTTTTSLLEEISPINSAIGTTSLSPAPWFSSDIPQLSIILSDFINRLSSFDRTVGVGVSGYANCHFIGTWANRKGASAGKYGRNIVFLESDVIALEPVTGVHELFHSWDLSELPCPIGCPACIWECEDEYNWTEPIESMTRGVRIGTNQNVDGRNCIMAGTGGTGLSQWVHDVDYERLIEFLSGDASPVPSIHFRLHLELGLEGSFYPAEVARIVEPPDFESANFGGTALGDGTTSLVFRDTGGAVLDTTTFTPEHIGEDGTRGFGFPDDVEAQTEVDFAVVARLPALAKTVDLVRRFIDPISGLTEEAVVDSLPLTSPPFLLELITPLSAVPLGIGDRLDIEWHLLPPSFGAETQRGSELSGLSYVLVSPDNGATWFPEGNQLTTSEFTWTAAEPGNYLVRVVATTGFETEEVIGLIDSDFDGCPDAVDNSPQPDPDTTDGDGIADLCDNCLFVANPDQADRDLDGIGDLCDVCPLDFDPEQKDDDGDLVGDLCDCAPNDAGAKSIPFPIDGLSVSLLPNDPNSKVRLEWQSGASEAGPSILYDVIAGDVAESSQQQTPIGSCVLSGLQGEATEIDMPVSPGMATWFLIRGTNVCGDGGFSDVGTQQPGLRDAALGQVCP